MNRNFIVFMNLVSVNMRYQKDRLNRTIQASLTCVRIPKPLIHEANFFCTIFHDLQRQHYTSKYLIPLGLLSVYEVKNSTFPLGFSKRSTICICISYKALVTSALNLTNLVKTSHNNRRSKFDHQEARMYYTV